MKKPSKKSLDNLKERLSKQAGIYSAKVTIDDSGHITFIDLRGAKKIKKALDK